MDNTGQSVLYNTEEKSGIIIITTMEDMDLYSAIQIKEHFNNLCAVGKTKFIINLQNTRYLDSSGLGVLIHIHTTASKDQNIMVRFINIATTVLKVLKLTHLDNMFWIAPDLETAIKEISSQVPGSAPPPSQIDDENNETATEEEKPTPAKVWEEVDEDDLERADDDEDEIEEEIQKRPKPRAKKKLPEQKEAAPEIKQIIINGDSVLFHKAGLKYKKFFISIPKIQKALNAIFQHAHMDREEREQLEHQVYELLKNAVQHGNKGTWWKGIKVWYAINPKEAHFVIEDQGSGFLQLEQWNELYKQRALCYQQKDRESLKKFRSFRTEHSDKSDRGTALFSAIEYWNGGIAFNDRRNSVAAKVIFK